MSFHGLSGFDIFGGGLEMGALNGTRYLYGGEALQILQNVANDTVTLLLSGQGGYVRIQETEVAYLQPHPEIAAIFGSHEQTARILGATVLATMIQQQREKKTGKLDGVAMASALPYELELVMRNGGDPSACQMQFEESFKNWAALSSLSVPTSVSKTGWCEKSLALPWKPDGHIASCKVGSICKAGSRNDGTLFIYEAPPPPPSDPRVPAPGSITPTPPPTKSQIEADIRKKMEQSGETLAEAQKSQAWTELAAYLTSLAEAKAYLTMGLGLPLKATDGAVVKALSDRGIPATEALDWFYGCNFDANCFRQTMNLALGESDDRARDRVTKSVVILGALAAIGIYFWKVR